VNSVAGEVEILPVIALTQIGSSIAVTTSPAGAAVNAGADYLGVTPLTLEATPNRPLTLTISRNGYQSVVRDVQVGENEIVEVSVELVALMGSVIVEATPLDAQLFVDGEPAGLANQELTLAATEHDFEIRSSGFQTWASRITPTPGIPQRIDVSLLTEAQARLANLPESLDTSMEQRLVLVKPGNLTLGATNGSQGRRANEIIRQVELTRPFYIGTTEVTNRQFARFNGRHSSATEQYPGLDGPEQPVVNISWNEAAAYCNWLSDREGLPRAYIMVDGDLRLAEPVNSGYRLPTEAEWAWVARFSGGLGNERRFSWGAAMPPFDNAGNYADASAIDYFPNALLGYRDGAALTAKVASYESNPLGVFDLGGNVAEWTNDYYSSAATEAILMDPLGPATGPGRVIRGSSWRESTLSDLRLVARDFGTGGQVDIGFRLARYAPQLEVTESDEQPDIN
jgi:formylglycine-generating enzyme required for sulfatase activity